MELYPKKTVWPFPVTISNYIAWQGIDFLTQFKPYQRLFCFFQQLVIERNQKKKKETAHVGDLRPGLLQRVVSRLLHCEPSLDPPVVSLHEVHLHMQDLLMLPPAIIHLVLGTSTQQAKNPWGLYIHTRSSSGFVPVHQMQCSYRLQGQPLNLPSCHPPSGETWGGTMHLVHQDMTLRIQSMDYPFQSYCISRSQIPAKQQICRT